MRRQIALVVGLALGLSAVVAGKATLLMWAAVVAGMAAAAVAWTRVALRGVEVTARFDPPRIFAGEPVAVRVRIANGKPLPLPLVRLSVRLPQDVLPVDPFGPPTVRGFMRRLHLPGRSEATLELPVHVRRRGEYRLDGISVEVSDPFDLVPVERLIDPDTELLVMPEPRISVPAQVLRRLPFGVPAPGARLFEERERFAGVRPYEPGDPLNRVHWKLSAHSGRIELKLFEPARTADVLLVLDLAGGEPFWDSIFPKLAEDAIGWASFLARQAFGAGWRVGLVANTHLRRGRGPLRVLPSSSRGHEAALFAALARMPGEPTSDLAPVLREVGRRLARYTSVVLISSRPGPALRFEIEALRRRGPQVVHLSPIEALPAEGAG